MTLKMFGCSVLGSMKNHSKPKMISIFLNFFLRIKMINILMLPNQGIGTLIFFFFNNSIVTIIRGGFFFLREGWIQILVLFIKKKKKKTTSLNYKS